MPVSIKSSYKSAWNIGDFMAADVLLTAGQFIELGRVTVPAGTGYQLGAGTMTGQDNAEGRAYLDLETSVPAAINGEVRFDLVDPTGHTVTTLWEGRTEQLRTTEADRRTQIPMPAVGVPAGKDYAIVLRVNADTTATAALADCKAIISATIYNVQQL